MAMEIQNPNDPTYWEGVKKQAALRNAINAFDAKVSGVRVGQIYARYLADLSILMAEIEQELCLVQFEGKVEAFRQACANQMQIQELAEEDVAELIAEASFAKQEAAQLIYGDYAFDLDTIRNQLFQAAESRSAECDLQRLA